MTKYKVSVMEEYVFTFESDEQDREELSQQAMDLYCEDQIELEYSGRFEIVDIEKAE